MVHEDSDCQHIMPILMTSRCYVKMTPQDILSWDIHLLQLSSASGSVNFYSTLLLSPTADMRRTEETSYADEVKRWHFRLLFGRWLSSLRRRVSYRWHNSFTRSLSPSSHMFAPDVLTIPNHQHIIQHTHSVAHHLWHISTPTCFGTEVPYSGSHYNKGI